MLKKILKWLLKLNDLTEKYGVDKLLHAGLLFIAVYFGWCTWFAGVFVGILIEFEQWNCLGRPGKGYLLNKMLPDLLADAAGIMAALMLLNW